MKKTSKKQKIITSPNFLGNIKLLEVGNNMQFRLVGSASSAINNAICWLRKNQPSKAFEVSKDWVNNKCTVKRVK